MYPFLSLIPLIDQVQVSYVQVNARYRFQHPSVEAGATQKSRRSDVSDVTKDLA